MFKTEESIVFPFELDVNLVTEPKPHQKSTKTSTVSNGSETSGDMTTETENNSMENCVESDINYTNFENTINEMIVECDSVHSETLHSHHNEKCGSYTNSQQLSEVQTKRVKLDISPELPSETTLDSITDILSENNKSCENSLQYSTDDSKGRSDSKTTYADPNINKHLINSSDNNCCYLSEQQNCSSSLGSLLSNPTLSLLLSNNNNNNNSQRSAQETLPLALSQVQQQSYDILICGNCRTFFTSLPLFIQHKRSSKCRLRFVCRCQPK